MKQYIFLLMLVVSFSVVSGQAKLPQPDKSPMDICYYPDNYPVLKIQNKVTLPPVCRIVYSRPFKNGREVYGELIEFGKVWRLGANEATELELFKDAKVNNQKLKKGRYSMFAIPYPDKWTIIINKDTDVWGAFQYDQKKDVTRFDVKTEKINEAAEAFTMFFDKGNDKNTNLVIAWDKVKTTIPFSF
ncbi:MAG: DUF2911 domain-containing protein [Flavitalea sp.]